MAKKLPMPSRKELTAMTDEDLEKRLQLARAAMQEAQQLARNSNEQEHVFTAYEKEQKRRTKSALQVELESGENKSSQG
jgi:hypothetical protein